MKLLLWIILAFLSSGSAALCQTAPDSIIVLPVTMAAPADARKLGSIKAGNNATATDCDYVELILSAKAKARKMGGNLVKITQLVAPAFISKCYKIEADVYFVKDMPGYKPAQPEKSINADKLNPGYALLCIYRLADTLALEASYNLHLDNDSVICRIKSKSRDSVKIYRQGTINLWAETEKRTDLKLDVKNGEVYYIRCGLGKGEIRMIPALELMNKETGAKEFEKGGKKKKINEVRYLYDIH